MARQSRSLVETRFEGGFARGWVFGVSEAFKAALDIRFTPRVLGPRSILKRSLEGLGIDVPEAAMKGDRAALSHLEALMREKGIAVADTIVDDGDGSRSQVIMSVETEGRPGAYGFAVGDTLHEPAIAHRLPWAEALGVLRRSVQVIAGSSASYSETEDIEAAGEVTAILRRYREGRIIDGCTIACTQAEFVRLLRDGVEPDGSRATPADTLWIGARAS